MRLPIDARNAPFRDKYIDSETPVMCRWMVFGVHPLTGLVDIADSTGDDVFTMVDSAKADRIVALRNKFSADLLEILNET